MNEYEGRPSRLTDQEIFVIFDVIHRRGNLEEAGEEIHRKVYSKRSHRTTVAAVFNVGRELFKRGSNAPDVLTDQEVDEIIEKAGYGVSPSRVVGLHRLYQLWKIRRREETEELGSDAIPQLRPELESVPHDKATLNTCFASAISGINWEAEPYVFVPAEADDALKAVFESLREIGGRNFHIEPNLENQVCGELQGKIISVPLPLKKATEYLEFRKALEELGKIFSQSEGIEAIKVEAAKYNRR